MNRQRVVLWARGVWKGIEFYSQHYRRVFISGKCYINNEGSISPEFNLDSGCGGSAHRSQVMICFLEDLTRHSLDYYQKSGVPLLLAVQVSSS